MSNRAETTLFLIESVDGKISTGSNDHLDIDKDFPRIIGVREGLHQYYKIEQQIAQCSLNTGRVMAKIGVNTRTKRPTKMSGVQFVILDSAPHLSIQGVRYLADWVETLYLATTNKQHPVYQLRELANIEIIEYEHMINLPDLLQTLKQKYGIQKLTLQSGGTLNAAWLRQGLIDHISIVVAPCLIGGQQTQSLIGGSSLATEKDLQQIKALRLINCEVLSDSYIHLQYDVLNSTQILE